MPIYNKMEIGRVAQQYGFVRDTFEKVLRLKEILKYMNEEEYLKEHLLLKGGTAINLTIFNLPRLSVDIDMDYTPNDIKKDMLEAREKMTKLIKAYIKELMQMTDKEKEYIERFIAKEYVPELLFEDAAVVERLKKHHMAAWKCQQ